MTLSDSMELMTQALILAVAENKHGDPLDGIR